MLNVTEAEKYLLEVLEDMFPDQNVWSSTQRKSDTYLETVYTVEDVLSISLMLIGATKKCKLTLVQEVQCKEEIISRTDTKFTTEKKITIDGHCSTRDDFIDAVGALTHLITKYIKIGWVVSTEDDEVVLMFDKGNHTTYLQLKNGNEYLIVEDDAGVHTEEGPLSIKGTQSIINIVNYMQYQYKLDPYAAVEFNDELRSMVRES